MSKQNAVRMTTPSGIAVYPKVETPDTKFNADGEYSIQLDLTKDESADIITKLTKFADVEYANECKAKGKKSLKRAELPWKETEDGKIRFKFKLKAKGKSGDKTWDQKPALFDAKGNPTKDVSLGGGSTVKVAFEAVSYYTAMVGHGITLRLKAVQILDLRQWVPGNGFDSLGFKAEEGFVAENTEASTEPNAEMPKDSDF
jgi:hypothetical protein